ncbi:MAG: LPS assembly lipoprotein LptE [Desulfuromonadaceae bacterium]|nr:LPS assembly lipoprotein LptE [Desulfuromonadaceae bacterium]
MTDLSYYRLLLLLPLLYVLTGCGYHLTNSVSERLAVGQQLWVPFIGNESVSPTAQTVLRRALYDECHALRGMVPAKSEGSAGLIMKGRLLSYSNSAVAYSAVDRVRFLRLTLSVELELYRRGEAAPLWKGVLEAAKDYPANTDLALQRNAEESALDAASRIIAQKFISAAEQSY